MVQHIYPYTDHVGRSTDYCFPLKVLDKYCRTKHFQSILLLLFYQCKLFLNRVTNSNQVKKGSLNWLHDPILILFLVLLPLLYFTWFRSVTHTDTDTDTQHTLYLDRIEIVYVNLEKKKCATIWDDGGSFKNAWANLNCTYFFFHIQFSMWDVYNVHQIDRMNWTFGGVCGICLNICVEWYAHLKCSWAKKFEV